MLRNGELSHILLLLVLLVFYVCVSDLSERSSCDFIYESHHAGRWSGETKPREKVRLTFLSLSFCRYLCKLSDQELRQSAARNMADLMWSTVKEPLDSALCFDRESLDLAFKYFMSPTLTMRLAGLSQITVQDTTLGHTHTLFVFLKCLLHCMFVFSAESAAHLQ